MGTRQTRNASGRTVKGTVQEQARLNPAGEVLEKIGLDCETLLDHINDGVYMLNNKGYCEFVNKVIEQRSGMSLAKFQNLHFSDIVSPDDHSRVQRNFEEVMKGEEMPTYELAYLTPNGKNDGHRDQH
jgi:PAS domain-containing protein